MESIEKSYQQYLIENAENKKTSYKSYFVKIFKKNDVDNIKINNETQVNLF